jgi:hypothetical protein
VRETEKAIALTGETNRDQEDRRNDSSWDQEAAHRALQSSFHCEKAEDSQFAIFIEVAVRAVNL